MDPQSAIAHLSWLQITQVTPSHIALCIFDSCKLAAENCLHRIWTSRELRKLWPILCSGRHKVSACRRRGACAHKLSPLYAVGTGSNMCRDAVAQALAGVPRPSGCASAGCFGRAKWLLSGCDKCRLARLDVV